MKSYFHLDLNTFPLKNIFNKIYAERLYKSRKILIINAEDNFEKFISHGIISCQEFLSNTSNKNKISKLSELLNIDVDYLTILRREVNSYKTKPVNFAEMPGIDDEILEKLFELDITHTKHFFDAAYNVQLRLELQNKLEADDSSMTKLLQISDLSRINGVGVVFIYLCLEAGINSSKQFSEMPAEEISELTYEVNERFELTKIWPKVSEIKICQEYAAILPDLQY